MNDRRPSLLLLLAFALCGGHGLWAETWEQSAWRQAVYYRATFAAPGPGPARLHVAAADSYEVYLNGAPVGSDSVHTRMNGYDVNVVSGNNHLAAKVVNRGRGGGVGLVAVLLGDSLRVETSANRRVQPWYWTAEAQSGTAWTTAAVENTWSAVQEGALEKGAVAGLVDTALTAVAGLPNGVDTGSQAGAITLSQIRGENLARGKPATHPEVVDGDLNVSWDPPTNSLNFFASVDLQVRHHVHAVRVLTRGANATQYAANSLRGYSVQVSDDQIRWTEVGVLHDITQFAWTEVRFAPVWTRYVRVVIVDIDPTGSPRVAEMEVYGDGYRDRGVYLSAPEDLGAPGQPKNVGRVRWDAEVPPRTEMAVRFRTGDDPADFADPDAGWSDPLTVSDVWFPAPEPARLLQYRVDMRSFDDRRSPRFSALRLDYSTQVAASASRGRVAPNSVPMGEDTLFAVTVDLDIGPGDAGVERLAIDVPGEATLDGGAAVAALLAGWSSTQTALTLTFAAPLRAPVQLEIPFRTRSYAGVHRFRPYLFAPGSQDPLNVAQNTDTDLASGQPYSWSVRTTTSTGRTLSRVGVNPGVLTPNGDGANDDTVIEFVLAKVDTPRRVEIRIFDLSGRLVRDLQPAALAAGAYLRLQGRGTGPSSPGYWNGRDESGNLVPPGLYLYRVAVDLDTGDEGAAGVVSVAY